VDIPRKLQHCRASGKTRSAGPDGDPGASSFQNLLEQTHVLGSAVNLTAFGSPGRLEHGQVDRATAAFASEVLQ